LKIKLKRSFILKNITTAAMTDNNTMRNELFAYLPITFTEDVRYICIASVKGS
jgi:hypothetical protein